MTKLAYTTKALTHPLELVTDHGGTSLYGKEPFFICKCIKKVEVDTDKALPHDVKWSSYPALPIGTDVEYITPSSELDYYELTDSSHNKLKFYIGSMDALVLVCGECMVRCTA